MTLPSKLRTAGIIGGAIAAGVLVNALIARRTERRNPPKGQFIEVRGVCITSTGEAARRSCCCMATVRWLMISRSAA
jgi:hypothetical protein